AGTGYTVAITAWPPGYDVSGPATRTFDIATVPVTGQDFTLTEQPSVSGTVTGGGDPLGGVTVTLTPTGGGTPQTTVTRGDGGYDFAHVPAGGYTISVTPPTGYRPTSTRSVTVAVADLTGQDFDLDRPGALGGTVTDTTGASVAGVVVHVSGPGGPRTVTTDAAGNYFVSDLDAGSYQVTITTPDGYRVSSTVTLGTTITSAGEIRGGLDFVLARIGTTPPTSPAGSSPSSPIAATGSPTGPLLLVGLLLLGVGGLLTGLGRRHRSGTSPR
ncbi:MAG: carboxypeptidase regulatory-like domain-containing protein, partial [Actinobacteria bacterium]|nr:carboxypeptidase regulatory-like domain-containing protein [Actinomycetota bacterium]